MAGMTWMFYVLPAVITVVVLVFVFRMIGGLQKAGAERQRILTTGIPAQAQIVGVQQTGTFINNNPEVIIYINVAPMGGQPYQATIRQVIQMVTAAQLAPGTVVPARIDQQDPTKVALAI